MPITSEAAPLSPKKKAAIVTVAIALVALLLWFEARPYASGLPPPERASAVVAPGQGALSRIDPQQREPTLSEKIEIARELGLTREQMMKMEQIHKGGPPSSVEELAERLGQFREVLEDEQFEQVKTRARELFLKRIELARQTLPPEEYAIYETRLREKARAAGLNLAPGR